MLAVAVGNSGDGVGCGGGGGGCYGRHLPVLVIPFNEASAMADCGIGIGMIGTETILLLTLRQALSQLHT